MYQFCTNPLNIQSPKRLKSLLLISLFRELQPSKGASPIVSKFITCKSMFDKDSQFPNA